MDTKNSEDQAPSVESTAEIIDKMAEELEYKAKELRRTAADMRKEQSLEYASIAMQTVASVFQNMRLDLLVSRPLRALGYKG